LNDLSFDSINTNIISLKNSSIPFINARINAYKEILDLISFGSIDQSLHSIYTSSLLSTLNTYKDILQQISFDSIDQSLNSIYTSSLIPTINTYNTILNDLSFGSIEPYLNNLLNNNLTDIQVSLLGTINESVNIIIASSQEGISQVNDVINQINNIDINAIF